MKKIIHAGKGWPLQLTVAIALFILAITEIGKCYTKLATAF